MEQYIIPKIDPKVFRMIRQGKVTENKAENVLHETPNLPIIIGAKAPPEIQQGIELYYKNVPFPRKGFPDADILNALNVVKKDLIWFMHGFASKYFIPELVAFMLFPFKRQKIDRLTLGFIRKAHFNLTFWYYLPQYYCVFAKELKDLIFFFLKDLKFQFAEDIGLVFCMYMEHDDRYRLSVQDLFNSTSKELLLKRPIRELRRLAKLVGQREHSKFTAERIQAPLDILCVILLIPKYRRAFKKAVRLVDWNKLKFDKGDEYWARTWSGYDAMGESQETRDKIMGEIHKDIKVPIVHIDY